jgi:hypothetical protein
MPRTLRPVHITTEAPECSEAEAARAFLKATEILLRIEARLIERPPVAQHAVQQQAIPDKSCPCK